MDMRFRTCREDVVKDIIDEDTEDSGQIISELKVRFNGSAGG